MYEIKEYMGSIYCFDVYSGEVLYDLSEPAVLFSADEFFTVHTIGNRENVLQAYNKRLDRLKGTGLEKYLILADLPKDLDILNKVYNNSMYVRTLFKDYVNPIMD